MYLPKLWVSIVWSPLDARTYWTFPKIQMPVVSKSRFVKFLFPIHSDRNATPLRINLGQRIDSNPSIAHALTGKVIIINATLMSKMLTATIHGRTHMQQNIHPPSSKNGKWQQVSPSLPFSSTMPNKKGTPGNLIPQLQFAPQL